MEKKKITINEIYEILDQTEYEDKNVNIDPKILDEIIKKQNKLKEELGSDYQLCDDSDDPLDINDF